MKCEHSTNKANCAVCIQMPFGHRKRCPSDGFHDKFGFGPCPCTNLEREAVWCKTHSAWHYLGNDKSDCSLNTFVKRCNHMSGYTFGCCECDRQIKRTHADFQLKSSEPMNDQAMQCGSSVSSKRLTDAQQSLKVKFHGASNEATQQSELLRSFYRWAETAEGTSFTPEQKKLLREGLASVIGRDR